MNSISLVVCESQPVVVEGLRRIFEHTAGFRLKAHAPELDAALHHASADCDVLLIGQPPTAKSPLPYLSRARAAAVPCQIVLWVTDLSDMDAFRALQSGARGIVTRTQPPHVLCECVRAVAAGSVWLDESIRPSYAPPGRRQPGIRITPREREIVEYVCRGLKNKEIADALAITPGTVKVHLMHIFEKTGVKDRFQLALQGSQILHSPFAEVQSGAGT